MAFTSLKDRLPNLPLILAGPILRKVTPSSVTVWLALKEAADVTLLIQKGELHPGQAMFGSPATSTISLGSNLHMVCVTARRKSGDPELTHGLVYQYDLAFKTETETLTLEKALKSASAEAISYGNRTLPTFVMPPFSLMDVRIFQGSCRKPNATGVDALELLDDHIEVDVNNETLRPHLMLMTGDQIYADEVAEVLLLMLTDAANALGVVERIPNPDGSFFAADDHPPLRRTAKVRLGKLTTDDPESHLISFGEFLAMYLFVWSDVLWPASLPEFDDVVLAIANKTAADQIVATKSALRFFREGINLRRAAVDQFRSSITKVRRALANIPVYMTFDDHEITDDWNMTQEFCENVYGNKLGFRIVQNGLLAYTLCQHWGNAPEQFEGNGAGADVLAVLNAAAKYNDIADSPHLQRMLGIHDAATLKQHAQQEGRPFAVFHDVGDRQQTPEGWIDSKSLLYHYSIEGRAFQIIVTDTRTWRSFPRGKWGAPDLIAPAQIPVQIEEPNTPALGERALIIVVSTNMPAGSAIRQAARDLPTLPLMGKKLIYEDLFDSWEIDRADFGRALASISRKFPARAGSLVLLSGDVHSSSVSRNYYVAEQQVGDKPGAPTKAELVLAELIGSALHNQGGKTLGQHHAGYAWLPEGMNAKDIAARMMAQKFQPKEGFVGWNPVTMLDDTEIGTQTIMVGTDEHEGPLRYNGQKATYTIRLESFGPVYSSISELKERPHYRMRLDYLFATARNPNNIQTISAGETETLKQNNEKAQTLRHYIANVRDGRQITGWNNISELQFQRPGDPAGPDFAVRYRIHWEINGKKQSVDHLVSLQRGDLKFRLFPDP